MPIVQEAGWAPGPVWTGAENLANTGTRSLDRSDHSQSLCRLSYPAHKVNVTGCRMMPLYENSRKDIRVCDHTGRTSTSMTGMNAARAKKLILGNKSNTRYMASTTKTRKQKWLFAIAFKSKRPVSTAAEFINSCQNETNISVW